MLIQTVQIPNCISRGLYQFFLMFVVGIINEFRTLHLCMRNTWMNGDEKVNILNMYVLFLLIKDQTI